MSLPRPIGTGATLTLLVVGDEARIRDVADVLERGLPGSTVETEPTGGAALERLAAADCVVVDPAIPDLAWEAFVDTVRGHDPSIPVVLVIESDVPPDEYLRREGRPPVDVADVIRTDDPPEIVGRRIRGAVDAARALAPGGLEWYRSVLEHADVPIAVIDPRGELAYVSPSVERVTGFTPDEVERRGLAGVVHPGDREEATTAFQSVVDGPLGSSHRDVYRLHHADETWHPHPVTMRNRVTDPVLGGVLVTIGAEASILRGPDRSPVRTTGDRSLRSIDRVRSIAQSLRDTETVLEACRRTADASLSIVGGDVAAVFLDETTGDGASNGDRRSSDDGDPSAIDGSPSLVTLVPDEAWAGGQVVPDAVASVLETGSSVTNADPTGWRGWPHRVERALVVPIPGGGALAITATDPGAFDDGDRLTGELIAAVLAVAIDRARASQRIREVEASQRREQARAERVRSLLGRLEAIADGIDAVTDRSSLESLVCAELASLEWLSFAWIGEVTPAGDDLEERERAGEDAGYLAAIDRRVDEEWSEPSGRTAATHRPEVIPRLVEAAGDHSWRREALARGIQSIASVPLVYDDRLYGVLSVYSTVPGGLDERTVSLLRTLGVLVAVTVNGLDVKRTITTDAVVELEQQVLDGEDPFVRLARELDEPVEVQRIVPRADGRSQAFFVVAETAVDRVREATLDVEGIDGLRILDSEGERVTYEATTTLSTIGDRVLDHGGVLRELVASPERTAVLVERPASAPVRPFVTALSRHVPGIELVARRERERPARPPGTFQEELFDRLTDQQRRALEVAYYAGYFEWPRDSTGEEVAASLGVSQPTFNRHLRVAERTLFDLLYGESN